MNNLFIFYFLCPCSDAVAMRKRPKLFSTAIAVVKAGSLLTFHFLLLTFYMSAPSILNTNRLFSDINCIPFTTQNNFSKADVDGLAPKSKTCQINKKHNAKIMSVLPIYNTARLNTDVTDINFRNQNQLIINHLPFTINNYLRTNA